MAGGFVERSVFKRDRKTKKYATKAFADDITLCCGLYFCFWGKIEFSCSSLSRE
jgi:hypothetical protein